MQPVVKQMQSNIILSWASHAYVCINGNCIIATIMKALKCKPLALSEAVMCVLGNHTHTVYYYTCRPLEVISNFILQ